MTTGSNMTPEDVINLLKGDSAFNRARQLVRSCHAKIEQGMAQRKPLSSLDATIVEFECVRKILALYGIEPETSNIQSGR